MCSHFIATVTNSVCSEVAPRAWALNPFFPRGSLRLASLSQVQLTSEVSAVLSSMGMAHTVNALIENELLVVDIALPGQLQQQPTALLIDGPADFTCNMPFRPLGATLLRWRLLLSCNWKVRRETRAFRV